MLSGVTHYNAKFSNEQSHPLLKLGRLLQGCVTDHVSFLHLKFPVAELQMFDTRIYWHGLGGQSLEEVEILS